MGETFDFLIVGAGIAGVSAAYSLALKGSVLLLEQEDHAGYHTTGRSAALFAETYGNRPIRALTKASRAFFTDPPDGLSDVPLLTPRGCLHIAREDQLDRLDTIEQSARDLGVATERLDMAGARDRVSVLRSDYIAGAVLEPDAMDIDVAALHHGMLKLARRAGVTFRSGARAEEILAQPRGFAVHAQGRTYCCAVLVDAAGAWADEIAGMAGVQPSGIRALRRTACVFAPPPGLTIGDWPAVVDASEQFYFKPDAGLVLASPADETLSQPCDAQPEEIDIATAIDRVQRAADLPVKRIRRSWAGLRNFTDDRTPVVGRDPSARISSGSRDRAATASRPRPPWGCSPQPSPAATACRAP